MPFALTATGADDKVLFLQSQQCTAHNQNYASGGTGAGITVGPSYTSDAIWKVSVLDPSILAQLSSHGQPVLANTFVSFMHVNTGQLICGDAEKLLKTTYGEEHVISTRTVSATTKGIWGERNGQAVGICNHFAFTTADGIRLE